MKPWLKETVLSGGLASLLHAGCGLSLEQEARQRSINEYDDAVKVCMEKFPPLIEDKDVLEATKAMVRESYSLIIRDKNPWPNGQIPYIFENGTPQQDKDKVLKAMQEWKNATNGLVSFVEKTEQSDYVFFQNKSPDCRVDKIGKPNLGGQQIVQITHPGCLENPGVILHELGHVLGLAHTHQLPGWEKHVVLLYGNTVNFSLKNFGGGIGISDSKERYDYDSVMGYPSNPFIFISNLSDDPNLNTYDYHRSDQPVLVRRDNCSIFDSPQKSISSGDVLRIKNLYTNKQP